jgi:hypothetical protein
MLEFDEALEALEEKLEGGERGRGVGRGEGRSD